MPSEHPPQRRNTRQRRLVLDAVRARDDHPTAEDIYRDVSARDSRISRGTVYRNLNLLEETGTIRAVQSPGATRFDRRADGHSHIVCRGCGRVIDAPLPYDEGADKAVAHATGYAIDGHSMLFEGLCPACQTNEPTRAH